MADFARSGTIRLTTGFCLAVFSASMFLNGCSILRSIIPPERTAVLARNDNYVIVVPGAGEDLRSLADRFLGDPERYWVIADANDIRSVPAGRELLIPLKPSNNAGIYSDGYQTIPILNYHRFGGKTGGKLRITAKAFEEQMEYLHRNGYRVVPLTDLIAFLNRKQALPKRSVVITIDDGHRSIYEVAYPILKKLGFHATVFVYSDYINNGGITSEEIREMVDSGLISMQPHSKTHRNLTLRFARESEEAYRRNIEGEVRQPATLLQKRYGQTPVSFAYPYGDANEYVIDTLIDNGYRVGLTVRSGSNPAFGFPYLLKRKMIFGDETLAEFQSILQTRQALDLR